MVVYSVQMVQIKGVYHIIFMQLQFLERECTLLLVLTILLKGNMQLQIGMETKKCLSATLLLGGLLKETRL